MAASSDQSGLKRALGLRALVVYGVGGMLGGGIYALVGEVAAKAGSLAWLSFLLAMVVATPTAFSYAALATRFPRSGGEAVYIRHGFGTRHGGLLVGWLVIFSGMASMATLAHAFAGYAATLLDTTGTGGSRGLILAFLLVLGAINGWGIRFTSRANIVATTIEFSGLLLVILAGIAVVGGWTDAAGSTMAHAPPSDPARAGDSPLWLGVLLSANLAFYAYIGFEDMVNVAEEVTEPRRVYPRAIVMALVTVGLVYAAVTSLATAAVSPGRLAASGAPLQEVIAVGAAWVPSPVFTVIALFAVGNSALLNFVMASRLAYGMANDGLLPRWLGRVHPARRTPLRAIGIILVLTAVLGLSGTLRSLAGTTSLLILIVFVMVNGSLLRIRLGQAEQDAEDPKAFRVPRSVPIAGMVLAVSLMPLAPDGSLRTAALVAGAGLALIGFRFLWQRWGD